MPTASAAQALTFELYLENWRFWVDIIAMMKTSSNTRTNKVTRDGRSGQFLGRTSDGTLIARPPFKPEGFTIRQLQKVIQDMRKEDADAKLG